MVQNIEELKKLIREENDFKFRIKVTANAKRSGIEFEKDYIKIKTTARAIEGKANKAIVEFLSELLEVPKTKIKILSGEKSSIKTLCIQL